MAEKRKSIGNTLLGLFVVRPEDELAEDSPPAAASGAKGSGDAAVDDLIARYGGGAPAKPGSRPPAPPAPPAGRPGTRPPRPPAGATGAPVAGTGTPPAADAAVAQAAAEANVPEVKIDFPGMLRRSGLSDEEQGRIEKALTLLHTLPAETPIEIKRQIVGASLQAFGFPIDQIIESAALHLKALDKHIKEGQTQTQALLEQSNRRMAELQQEVARVQQVMQEQLAQQQGLTASCNRQKLRVQEVLDFFGREAMERVAQTSVKLRDKLQES
ncbi:MAG TPA: hypothetical protein PLA87_01110 [Pseudomonadota bacterium]|nr:hypothetical protein [Pseudomonadota bacterium]